MNTTEFSNEFDVLYNNITSNQAPGLDEYEKSVFLTRAQDDILKAYFKVTGNKDGAGFDGSEKRQIDFSKLLKVSSLQHINKEQSDEYPSVTLDDDSEIFKWPVDIFLILNETLNVERSDKNITLQVVPISYTEYTRLKSKPFKKPIKSQAWRLQQNHNSNLVELIVQSNDSVGVYKIRYIKKPYPIILQDFTSDGLSIEGKSQPFDDTFCCELDSILHQEILQRAVELAKAYYQGDLATQISVGSTSGTNIGQISQTK